MTAQRAALAIIMHLENDYADATVPNTTAGGDTLAARAQQIATDFDAAYSGAKLVARLSSNPNGFNGKSVACARAKEVIAANSRFETFDAGAFFNPQDATQSTNAVHPNALKSVKALGNAIGEVIASKFVEVEVFNAGSALPNALNASAFNPATAWPATVNTTDLVAAQSTGFLRSKPSVPCRILTSTGTSEQDPSLGTAVSDHQLRLTIPLVARDTFALVIATLMLMEITSASGGDPIGLTTIQIVLGRRSTNSSRRRMALISGMRSIRG